MHNPYVYVCRNIALYARIIVDKPSTSNITSSLEDSMLNNVMHVGEPVLELVCHDQAGESGSDGEDLDFPRLVSKVSTELECLIFGLAIGSRT